MDKCMWCDKPATHYCDAVIGLPAVDALRDKRGNVTALLTGSGASGVASWTCDAPMCSEHTKQIGVMCGSEPDSIDHCPHHLKSPEQPISKLVMFEREVGVRRREVHAQIRRQQIRAHFGREGA